MCIDNIEISILNTERPLYLIDYASVKFNQAKIIIIIKTILALLLNMRKYFCNFSVEIYPQYTIFSLI